MPMTAMIRNLGKMSSMGMFKNEGDHKGEEIALSVAARLRDDELLKKAKIHPFNVLVALKQYSARKGEKGKLSWEPNQEIMKALDDCFYAAFKVSSSENTKKLLA